MTERGGNDVAGKGKKSWEENYLEESRQGRPPRSRARRISLQKNGEKIDAGAINAGVVFGCFGGKMCCASRGGYGI